LQYADRRNPGALLLLAATALLHATAELFTNANHCRILQCMLCIPHARLGVLQRMMIHIIATALWQRSPQPAVLLSVPQQAAGK
jgi:hypothetical protein